jgi:3-phosphoshikimate 1-carboxyvinyltransferase
LANRDPRQAYRIALGNGGTGARFLAALCCLLPGTFYLDGSQRLRERPLRPLIACLQQAGAQIEAADSAEGLPLTIHGNPAWRPESFELAAGDSSQFLSALLLLAPSLRPGTRIRLSERPPSWPYVELTLRLLAQLGLYWRPTDDGYELAAPRPQSRRLTIGGDWSAAIYPLGLLAQLGGRLTLERLQEHTAQGDAVQAEWWRSWGLELTLKEQGLQARAGGGQLPAAVQQNCLPTPDLGQPLAVIAAMGREKSQLDGLRTLRSKETDRIYAMAMELGKVGTLVGIGYNHMRILGNPFYLPEHPIATYGDHRMAMSFALLAPQLPGLPIAQPEVVEKSYPAFWAHLEQLGFQLSFAEDNSVESC